MADELVYRIVLDDRGGASNATPSGGAAASATNAQTGTPAQQSTIPIAQAVKEKPVNAELVPELTANDIAGHAQKAFNVAQATIGGGALAGATEAASAIPVAGLAIAASLGVVAVTIDKISQGIDERMKTFAEFSPVLAASKARNEALDIQNNIARANRNGGEFAQFNDAASKLSRQLDRIGDQLLEPLLNVMIPILESVGDSAEAVAKFMEDNPDFGKTVVASLADQISPVLGQLVRIAENTAPKDQSEWLSNVLLDQKWLDPPVNIFDVKQSTKVDGGHFAAEPGMRLP